MAQLARLHSHTTAVVDLLDTVKVKCFDAGFPDPAQGAGKGFGWQATPGASKFLPYRIVVSIPGGFFDGPLGCPSDDASLIFQVTCVGATRGQCEAVADDTNTLLVEQQADFNTPTPLIAGRYVTHVWFDMSGGVRRDDETQPPVFIATPRYRIDSVPLDGGP